MARSGLVRHEVTVTDEQFFIVRCWLPTTQGRLALRVHAAFRTGVTR
jgi:hypothetical protein